jgi:hypothetical protein
MMTIADNHEIIQRRRAGAISVGGDLPAGLSRWLEASPE